MEIDPGRGLVFLLALLYNNSVAKSVAVNFIYVHFLYNFVIKLTVEFRLGQEVRHMRDILKLSLILALICAVAGAALAATQSITSKIIEEREAEALTKALGELLPDADKFEQVEAEGATYYVATKGGKPVGAIMIAAGKGYGGAINLLVSIDMAGKVQIVRVTGHKETAGIGERVETPTFLGQFVNKSPADKLTVGQDIVAASGATVSSRGVTAGVKQALLDFQVNLMGMAAPTDEFNLSKVKDGVYTGEAEGYKSTITAEVTVAGGRITKVAVTHKDTPEIADDAVDIVAQRIIDKQHYQVDAMSGATFTSEGVMQAVKAAIPDTTLNISKIADGEYEGEGQGYKGPIKVKVTVADGKVTKIDIREQTETDYIAEPAFDSIPIWVIEKQSVEVDIVSSATFTSEGLIEAITNALESAPRK